MVRTHSTLFRRSPKPANAFEDFEFQAEDVWNFDIVARSIQEKRFERQYNELLVKKLVKMTSFLFNTMYSSQNGEPHKFQLVTFMFTANVMVFVNATALLNCYKLSFLMVNSKSTKGVPVGSASARVPAESSTG